MTISLCMIVKNEEAVLARCLESVKSGVDEIAIVDTGSSDATVSIARRYTPFVYSFAWRDDFSAARNFAFSKGTGDYLMWLDADDVVEGGAEALEALKELLETEKPDLVKCAYDTAFGEDGTPVYSYFRERFLRRDAHFLWEGRVHESIVPRGKIAVSPLRVRHLGSNKPRGARNLEIYRRQITEEGALSPRDLFYYGRELFYHKLYAEATAVLEEMLRGEGWYVNKIEACKVLAKCYLARADGESAVTSLLRSFLYGEPRASVCCAIGGAFKAQRRYGEAAFWYEAALSCRDHSLEGDFEEPLCRTLTPLLELTVCRYRLGDEAGARAAHERAEAIAPDHPSVRYNREFFRKK